MSANIVERLAQKLRYYQQRRSTVRVLSSLDDRALRDIGIDRWSIESAVEVQLRRKLAIEADQADLNRHREEIAVSRDVAAACR